MIRILMDQFPLWRFACDSYFLLYKSKGRIFQNHLVLP